MSYKVELTAQGIREQAEQLKRDLCDPLGAYTKQYALRNESMVKDANKIWTSLHRERTHMLLAKENFYSEMCNLHQMKRKLESKDFAKSLLNKESPQTKIAQQQLRADKAEVEYKTAINSVNMAVE